MFVREADGMLSSYERQTVSPPCLFATAERLALIKESARNLPLVPCGGTDAIHCKL